MFTIRRLIKPNDSFHSADIEIITSSKTAWFKDISTFLGRRERHVMNTL